MLWNCIAVAELNYRLNSLRRFERGIDDKKQTATSHPKGEFKSRLGQSSWLQERLALDTSGARFSTERNCDLNLRISYMYTDRAH